MTTFTYDNALKRLTQTDNNVFNSYNSIRMNSMDSLTNLHSTPLAPRQLDLSPTLHATSAVRKSGFSITLPRNFAPLSLDPTDAPRTPDQTFAELELPPPPAHSTYRVRRPRLNLDNFHSRNVGLSSTLFASEIPIPSSAGPWVTEFAADLTSDQPLPSIESGNTPTRPPLLQTYSEPLDSTRLRLMADAATPHTPPAQTTRTPAEIRHDEWDLKRASSVRTNRSDSSLSTTETYETRPTSYDGSVNGHDAECADPFAVNDMVKVTPATPQRRSKKLRLGSLLTKNNVEWTIDMDNHLFNVYQIYLADPTVTPFKTVPGSIPPTGVCHRVARRAKETWPKASRIPVPIVQRFKMRSMLDVRMTPRSKTPDPDNFLTAGEERRPTWPSESATRKRLKQLCREKFTISAHYNRLRESRSPSPFADQFLPRRPSRLSASPALSTNDGLYSTREMHINLVATGATEPLAQLTTGDSPPMNSALESFNRSLDANEASNSVTPTGLGIQEAPVVDKSKLFAGTDIPRLASPFNYNTWNGPVRPENHARRQIGQGHFDTMHATGPRLLSPFQPDGDMALNINKRRAQHNLEDELSPSGSSLAGHTSGLNLDEPPVPLFLEPELKQDLVFSGLGDISQRRIRLRNRGATLGTAHERIARLFTPMATDDAVIPPVPAVPSQYLPKSQSAPSGTLVPPQPDSNHRRLGSPFELDPNKRSFRNKPRHLPSLSDPFIQFTHGIPSSSTNLQHNNNIGNIGDRLASFQQSLDDYRTPQF